MRTVNKRGLKVGLFAVISFLSIGLMGNSEAVGINLPTHIERLDIIFYELNYFKKQVVTTTPFVPASYSKRY